MWIKKSWFCRVGLFLAVLCCLFLGCSQKTPSPPTPSSAIQPRVVVIGLDGADWSIIDRLERKGKLPFLARLRREGSQAVLQASPPLISPVVWTTLATGREPLDHGIFGFLTRRGGVVEPVRSDQRRVRAFWNVASENQVPVGVVGWYATWPAETVNGYLISDRLGVHQVGGKSQNNAGLAFPDALNAELLAERRDVETRVGTEFARRFFSPGADPNELPPEKYEAFLGQLRNTELFKSLFLKLNARFRPQIAAVYFEGTDAVGHLFGDFQPPAAEGVSPQLQSHFGGTFDEYYRYIDQVLSELLSGIDPQKTTVLIVSDHGFRSGPLRPRIPTVTDLKNQAPQWHRPEGVFLAWGRGILSGKQLTPVPVSDFFPTLMRLAGLPLSEKLAGRSVEGALSPIALADPVRSVPDYESRGLREKAEASGSAPGQVEDTERLAKLRALGYVGDQVPSMPSLPGGDGQETVPENVFNLGLLLQNNGRISEALQQFRRLQHDAPGSVEGFYGEGLALMSRGDFKAAIPPLRRAVGLSPRMPAPVALLGEALAFGGAEREGADQLTRALLLDPGNARALGVLGNILLHHRNLAQAEGLFQKAVEIGTGDDRARGLVGLAALAEEQRDFQGALAKYDEALRCAHDFPPALERAGNLCLALGRDQEALGFLERLVFRQPEHVSGLFLLGLANARLGNPREARTAWERALRLDPGRGEIKALLNRLPK